MMSDEKKDEQPSQQEVQQPIQNPTVERENLRVALGVKRFKKEREKEALAGEDLLAKKLASIKARSTPETIDRILDERAKGFIVYDSKEGSFEVNFNTRVKDANNAEIACRQLAYAVALRDMKGYSADFSTAKAIAQQEVLRKNEFDANQVLFKSTYYNLLPLDRFGEQLKNIAELLEPGEGCSLLFQSENHVMTVSIRHKENGTYAVKIYDPNSTDMHRRALCLDLNAVSQLGLNYFVDIYRRDDYFPRFKSGVFFSPLTSEASLFSIHPDTPLADQIYYFSKLGWEKKKGNNLSTQLDTLFHSAKTYIEAIWHSDLPNEEKYRLTRPGNIDFFQMRKPKLLQTYLQAVFQSTLSFEQKKALFEVRKGAGGWTRPLISMLIEHGETDKIMAYVSAIEEDKTLTPAQKQTFIEIPDLWGNTPLMFAAMCGRLPEMELLLRLGANTQAKNHKGETAFDVARNWQCRAAIVKHKASNWFSSSSTPTFFSQPRPKTAGPHTEVTPRQGPPVKPP